MEIIIGCALFSLASILIVHWFRVELPRLLDWFDAQ